MTADSFLQRHNLMTRRTSQLGPSDIFIYQKKTFNHSQTLDYKQSETAASSRFLIK